MGIKIGITGCGIFADSFIPLFQAHPLVDEVVVADLLIERAREAAVKYEIKRIFSSHEELLKSDVDAVAIFTQRHLHGPLTLQALDAGKHVYCAVPIAQSLEQISRIVEKVVETGLIYMTGETSYYYPSTIYCRKRFQNGDFGNFVYGEAQYLHDMAHGFYDSFKRSGGDNWKRVAGIPPMYYPTHSVSMILSITGARATHVSCLGYIDNDDDGIFKEGANEWNNTYSNESALVRTSDGGMCRFNEFRRVGWRGKNSVYMSMFGTKGSFEEKANSAVWAPHNRDEMIDLTDLLKNKGLEVNENTSMHEALRSDFYEGVSRVHPIGRLPKEFAGLKNGHKGSHQFLVDDFVKSVVSNKLPPNHVWAAARYCVPGLIAHQSALKDGEMIQVPDFGDAPAKWNKLDY